MDFFNKEELKRTNDRADAQLDPILNKAVSSNWTPLFFGGLVLASFLFGVFIGNQI